MRTGETGLTFGRIDGPKRSAMRSEKWLEAPGIEKRAQLAADANKRALERFHPAVIARRHLEIYREVLNTPGRGQGVIPVKK